MLTTTLTQRAVQLTVAASALAVLSTGVALACHPKGIITKGVTNVTAGDTTIHAADTTGTAITAKPGDVLKYTIVIRNDAPTTNSYDDIINTKLADSLPSGVELVSGNANDNLGTVKAKGSVTRTITVKVKASAKTGDVIDNKACFTGDAADHNKSMAQSGCDHAIVKVNVPTPPATPTPTPTPTNTPAPTPTPTPEGKGETLGTSTVTTLPATGAPVMPTAFGLSAMIGTSVAYMKSRKRK